MNWRGLRIAVVGPLPPPAGGMAGQTEQLARLLADEGAHACVVQTNAPYAPACIARVKGVRAAFRLLGYVPRLWRAAGAAQLLHVMANSGWSWHLYAVPAIAVARLRGRPVVVNYRGGEAAPFLARQRTIVRPALAAATAVVVPSGFLEGVFRAHGVATSILPNIVDLARFRPPPQAPAVPTILVARNLEPLYDNATAIEAFARVHLRRPDARLVVAGSGPEEAALKALAVRLRVADAVTFTGRLDRDAIAARYRAASVALNPSRVDNMPNSLLEAMASGVPIVSTDVGGVPHVVAHGRTALLVPPGDPDAMAAALLRLLDDEALARRLAAAGLAEVQRYAWPRVREVLAAVYAAALGAGAGRMKAA